MKGGSSADPEKCTPACQSAGATGRRAVYGLSRKLPVAFTPAMATPYRQQHVHPAMLPAMHRGSTTLTPSTVIHRTLWHLQTAGSVGCPFQQTAVVSRLIRCLESPRICLFSHWGVSRVCPSTTVLSEHLRFTKLPAIRLAKNKNPGRIPRSHIQARPVRGHANADRFGIYDCCSPHLLAACVVAHF
jgi:hypothetical protein